MNLKDSKNKISEFERTIEFTQYKGRIEMEDALKTEEIKIWK